MGNDNVNIKRLTRETVVKNERLNIYPMNRIVEGYTEIDEDAAEYLTGVNWYEKSLTLRLIHLSDSVAESISRFQVDVIRLNSITEMSDNAAKSLSAFKGELR